MTTAQSLSVNEGAAKLVDRIKAAAAELKIAVTRGELGETLIDAGSRSPGSIAAGLQVAEICMGGLGTVALAESASTPRWPWTLMVHSSNPVTACLASQYAGWRLSEGKGADAFFALGSGPARALAKFPRAMGAELAARRAEPSRLSRSVGPVRRRLADRPRL